MGSRGRKEDPKGMRKVEKKYFTILKEEEQGFNLNTLQKGKNPPANWGIQGVSHLTGEEKKKCGEKVTFSRRRLRKENSYTPRISKKKKT